MTDDDRLRRDSPAYRPDDDWDVWEPQGMDLVFRVCFDAQSARRIAQQARGTGQSPSDLIREWTLDRLTGSRLAPGPE